ncbi:MFS transporter [Brucella abortus S99]|uniref:MFS transporter n=1 Tax=Brucella abortus TaxID=235 RepID=UPI0003B1FA89|nr:MFS transporter [Brucella abortus]AUS58004.1 MFS transporter [Brucella abortus]ERM04427.1 MFS transporter [Brucella abortus S99]
MNPLLKPEGPTSYRYVIFAIVTILALVNYIDRGAISYASEQIIGEYGFNRADWGSMLGYFGYGYMFGAILGGTLSDKLGARKLWIIAGTAWSIVAVSMIWAGELGILAFGGSALAGFAVVRILFGFSEGPAYSIINKTMGNWAPRSERGFAVALGLLSTPLGAMLTAPIAVGLLLVTGSWRSMYIVLGALGLILIVIFSRIYTNRPEDHPKVSEEEVRLIRAGGEVQSSSAKSHGFDLKGFISNKTLVFNSIGYFAFQYVNFMILTWTPKYLSDEFGLTLSSLWYMGMVPWVGACVTILLGGKISDWLFLKTGKLRLARGGLAAASLAITTAVLLMIPHAGSAWGVIGLMTLANACNSLPNSVYWAVIIDSSPTDKMGTYSGITHFIANIATILSPTLAVILAMSYGYNAMFVATAVATAIGMIAMLSVKPGQRV